MNHHGSNSFIKWLGICLALIALVMVAITVFKIPAGIVFLGGILLLCPLMHFWMMKNGGHKH